MGISGTDAGQTWPVRGQSFSTGRGQENDLQILHAAVSREHCVLRRRGERLVVQDLDSRHGTFVNRLPVHEHQLEHGDLLTIAETRLLFLLDDPSEAVPEDAASGGREPLARTTLEKKPTETLYLHLPAGEVALPAAAHVVRDLRAVLELGRALQALRRGDHVAERLLDAVAIREGPGARRGAEVIRSDDLPDEVLEADDKPPADFQATVIETKKKLILAAFRDAGGDHREAARILGLHVNSLHRLIRNLKLKSQLGKPDEER